MQEINLIAFMIVDYSDGITYELTHVFLDFIFKEIGNQGITIALSFSG